MDKYLCEPCGYIYDPKELLRARRLKTCRRIGYAHGAGLEKMFL